MRWKYRPVCLGRVLAALLVAGVLGLGSVPDAYGEEPTAQEAYASAKDAFKAGDLNEALRLLEFAHHKDPQPLFIYNIGRVKFSMGKIREAYETYLRLLALKETDDNLRRLAEAQTAKLKGLIDKAFLKVLSAGDGATVQVGDGLITDFDEDLEYSPGKYRGCVVLKGGKELRCVLLKLKAGRRIDWDVSRKPKTSGRIMVSKKLGLKGITLDGTSLLVDASKLRAIEVEAGRHEFKYSSGKGEGTKVLQVLPGAKLPWKTGGAKKISGKGKKGFTPVQKEAPGAGPGVMPWVVTGVGVAVAGAGGYFAHAGSSEQSQYESDVLACKRSGKSHKQCVAIHPQSQYDDAGSKIDLGMALVGAGGACAIGGIVWWYLSKDQGGSATKSARRGTQPQWWIQPDLRGGIIAVGRF